LPFNLFYNLLRERKPDNGATIDRKLRKAMACLLSDTQWPDGGVLLPGKTF